jgi:hypothetical protein
MRGGIAVWIAWIGLIVTVPGADSYAGKQDFSGAPAFVQSYFGDDSFSSRHYPVRIARSEAILYVAESLVDSQRSIADKAVVYRYVDETPRIELMVLGSHVFLGDGSLLVDADSAAGSFFGWRIDLELGEDDSLRGVYLALYTNDGTNVTETPQGPDWDDTGQRFVRRVIDWSQF